MKYFNLFLLLFLFAASVFLYSVQSDSIKTQQNDSTVKHDIALKDSANVDKSYHLIGYVGSGVGYPTYFIINTGLEIPFTYENYISFVLNLGIVSDYIAYPTVSSLIKFNPSIKEKFYFSFCVGIGAMFDSSHLIPIFPLGFSISYAFDKCLTLSLLFKGETFLIFPPSLSLNLYFKL